MPHAIIKGRISAEDIWYAFQATEFVEKGNRFKAEEAYLATNKSAVLVRSVTIERGFTKSFFVKMTAKEDGFHVGIDHQSPVERSEGVKRLIGLYVWKILQSDPTLEVGSSNIAHLIMEPQQA